MHFDYRRLRGKIREVYGKEEPFANDLGIGRVTLSRKLNNKVEFTSTEIVNAIKLLDIDKKEIQDYFFTLRVRKSEQDKAV